jgi:CrcB protein
VNILGCLLIGVIAGLTERFNILPEYRLFLAAGICAGFTTFSSFAFENVSLLQENAYLTFGLYTVLSFVLGIAATILGLALTRG